MKKLFLLFFFLTSICSFSQADIRKQKLDTVNQSLRVTSPQLASAVTFTIIQGTTSTFSTNLNAWQSANPTKRIYGFSFIAGTATSREVLIEYK